MSLGSGDPPVALWWEAALQIRDSGDWELPQCRTAAPFRNPNPVNMALPVGWGGVAHWGLKPQGGNGLFVAFFPSYQPLSKNINTAAV